MTRRIWAISLVLTACAPTGVQTPQIAIAPRCEICAWVSTSGVGRAAFDGQIFVSERAGPDAGFAPFRGGTAPLGDPTIGPNAFAVNESWLREPVGAKVYRGQVVQRSVVI